jgi:hypothetical protein
MHKDASWCDYHHGLPPFAATDNFGHDVLSMAAGPGPGLERNMTNHLMRLKVCDLAGLYGKSALGVAWGWCINTVHGRVNCVYKGVGNVN